MNWPTDTSIPAKLDVAKRALSEATTDWERIDIRDYARAVAAATAILERKEIQIQAANLVQDAERAIAKANPAIPPQVSGKKGGDTKLKGVISDNTLQPPKSPLSQQDVSQIRLAHQHITDEEFEGFKQESIETETTLSRRASEAETPAGKARGTRLIGCGTHAVAGGTISDDSG